MAEANGNAVDITRQEELLKYHEASRERPPGEVTVLPLSQGDRGNEDKLAELILYIAGQIRDDPDGGATKINKILYFAEFRHMRMYGTPITGVPYQKLTRGPAPRRLRPVRQQLINSDSAVLERDDYLGYPVHRLIPKRPFNRSLFTDEEIDTVDRVVRLVRPLTASAASELSHEDMGWRMVVEGETIPYSSAFLVKEKDLRITDEAKATAARLLKEWEASE